jgi:HTH-type transcriptional regulator/antitoxin HigA
MVKLIKTNEDYARALSDLAALVAVAPAPGTPEAERLELLGLLLEQYEETQAPPRAVDPLEAIRFRMDQQGLTPRDLVPYIGSRARVSEVLSGRRPLTLPMIRALHRGLGIPAESLIAPDETSALTGDNGDEDEVVPWEKFPAKIMAARGWIPSAKNAAEAVREFFAPLSDYAVVSSLFRRTTHVRTGREMDRFALVAWTARILFRAGLNADAPPYERLALDAEFLASLVRLSCLPDGPRQAIDALRTRGVLVVIEPHLPKTWLDGAAMLGPSGHAVIGLTLRHDRLDNYWFTLMHELMHVQLHIGYNMAPAMSLAGFYDDLDAEASDDPREQEADAAAGEMLVPAAAWETSAVRYLPSPETVTMLARQIGVHPSIVAGRVRHQRKAYRLLAKLVGHGEVRRLFPDVTWEQ